MQFPFKLLHQKTKPRNQFISIHLQDFKDLEQEKAFSPYAFQGIPVLDFVQTGQRMLVISPRISGKTDSLLLFSEDRGKSFRDLTSNLATEDKPETARGMAQNPQNPETVLLATDRGLYVSRNFGESWTRISDSNVIYPVVEFHPLDTNTVFLAGLSAESRKGIIETLDLENGISSVYHLPDEENPISDLLFNPWNPDEIWFAGSGDAKIGKSQDQGASWQIVWAEQDGPLQLNMTLFHAMGNMDTVYAASGSLSSEVRVSRSMDAGSSWDELYYERFFFLDAMVLPFDIIRYGHDLLFYYDFALSQIGH